MLYFFLAVLVLSAAATVTNIKIRYDAITLQFALFGTRVICVFCSSSSSDGHHQTFHANLCCEMDERDK